MWKNLALLIVTLMLSVGVLEFGLQKTTRLTDTLGAGRYLYYSENPWRKISFGDDWVITLQDRARIESFASYGGKIEYEYLLETNRFGYRQTECTSQPGKPVIPVLGDSYTQATGGTNWLNETNRLLSRRGSPFCYMNAAVAGTGFESWIRQVKMLDSYFRPKFQVVVFITDDIPRVHFFAREADGKISLCYEVIGEQDGPEERCSGLPIYTERNPPDLGIVDGRDNLMRKLLPATTELFARALNRGRNRATGILADQAKLEQMLIEKLDRLQKAYDGEMLVIRIPSKADLMVGSQPFSAVKATGRLEYREVDCGLQSSDFHRNDEHPNRSGYSKIASCIAAELRQFEQRLAR